MLSAARASGHFLLGVLNEILTLNRITSGQLGLELAGQASQPTISTLWCGALPASCPGTAPGS